MVYQLVQAVYWLALSTWFGSAMFVAVGSAAMFRVLRERQPVLPDVLAVNLEGQHGTLLGSQIMSELLRTLGVIQMVCAAVVIVGSGLHFVIGNIGGQNFAAAVLRVLLAATGGGLVIYDRFVLGPRIARSLATYVTHADEPERANAAKDSFDRDQQRLLSLVLLQAGVLAGLVLFSAAITPRPVVLTVGG